MKPATQRKSLLVLLVSLMTISFLGLDVSVTLAKPTKTPKSSGGGNAYDLIAAVNSLRSAHGLPPYQINGALMAAAQAHSDYQASIGSGTHTGAGGTRPKDRAAAAGYGGGATIFISENIAWGTSMTVQAAVQIWQGDDLHLNTMLGANYTDAGAGIATAGGMTYFTLDVGYVSGSPGSGATTAPGSTAVPPAFTVTPFFPVVAATPLPDGSIVHTVQAGQTLWTIAVVYKVNLPDMLKLNGLTGNTIYVGQKILVKAPGTAQTAVLSVIAATVMASDEPVNTIFPTQTSLVEATETRSAPSPQVQDDTTSIPPITSPPTASAPASDPLLVLIAVLVFGGTALIVLGNMLRKK